MERRGAVQLSFGMLFSIILIIAFLAFGFYAIKTFLHVNDSAKEGTFIKNLQNDVDDLWRGSQGNQQKEYPLSSKIEEVCFVNEDSEGYISFKPKDVSDLDMVKIEHIDIRNMTRNSQLDPVTQTRSYCVNTTNDKVGLEISKEYGQQLVFIKKW